MAPKLSGETFKFFKFFFFVAQFPKDTPIERKHHQIDKSVLIQVSEPRDIEYWYINVANYVRLLRVTNENVHGECG